ncbi:uncharacterized protein LOC107981340 [Nasonia vitripennis]|uniref:Uncharacterized protein n=1 Tax=Nasonia vitripennis TaxID=7425 RepID=A0A7M7ITQ2_NASVI|nr:uncharacterized protein LOC107981340 [Nasonia vitripennis]
MLSEKTVYTYILELFDNHTRSTLDIARKYPSPRVTPEPLFQQLLSICAVVLYGSVVMAGLSIHQRELERAAELAVERAAEKAAERAVEKALNSGNSSTVTVTVKESYSNAMKTAEEQAAPGSESTRPYDPKIYDRQYGYSPPGQYQVNDSAEAEELGISKESLNSSVENAGAATPVPTSAESVEADRSVESVSTPTIGFDAATKDGPDEPATSSISSVGFDVSTSAGLGFSAADFSTLDSALDDVSTSIVADSEPGFKGDFGLKSSTKTFSSSYSKSKDDDFSGTKVVDVDDDEDAEIFKMYASDFGDGGWTSAKQKGWVRHRPLWDDNKKLDTNNKDFWSEDFSDISAGETQNKDSQKVQPPSTPTSPTAQTPAEESPTTQKTSQVVKRMVKHYTDRNQEQVAVPLATLSLDPKTPAALYQLLQREVKFPINGYDRRLPMPMKVYVTIPVPYLPSYGIPKSDVSSYGSQKSDGSSYGFSKSDGSSYGSSKSDGSSYGSSKSDGSSYGSSKSDGSSYGSSKSDGSSYGSSKNYGSSYDSQKSDGSSYGSQKSDDYDQSKESEPNRYELAVPPNPYNDEMNEEPYPTTTEPIKRSFQLDKDEEHEEKEGEAKQAEKEDKEDSSVTEGTTSTNKTLILIVPHRDSNSGEKRSKSEVAVGQPHPFQVNTPLKLFDPKRPETEVPQMTT